MDPYGQNNSAEERQFLDPYQRQQVDNWKNRVHKLLLDAWPYFYRFLNELLLIIMKVIRGSIRITKEQLFKN